MLADAYQSVVIVDRSGASGYRLRNCLLDSAATAHVFNSFAAALAMIQRKKIDAVVIEFNTDKATRDFCDVVKNLNVPVVFSSAPLEPLDLRQYGFQATFPNLPHAPNLRVQYAHPKNS